MFPHWLRVCVHSGMLKMMEEDKRRFGAAAWASAAPRLERLCFVLAKETLQHMRATEMCLNRKKSRIREKVRGTRARVAAVRVRAARKRFSPQRSSVAAAAAASVGYESILQVTFTSICVFQRPTSCVKSQDVEQIHIHGGTCWRRAAGFRNVEPILLSLKSDKY